MGVRHILPDWVLSHFAQGMQCGTPDCGHRSLEVFCPMVRRKRAMVELVFPCKCSCGQRGHFVICLHVLVFGFLLANVAFVKASRRGSKSSMTIYPHSSDVVAKLLNDFDAVVTKYLDAKVELTDDERRHLGLSEEDWAQFRRRMGYPDEEAQ